ncbi:MAG: thiamine phosphate synthase [Candidatus Melainabacteria bacterium]|nr:thiamine phosphate synthase [Candidatus Melainabacteria bacterium]
MPRNDIYRIIDANINRASEALRVLEDWARYSKDDKAISEKLKNIRHEINNLFSTFPNFILSRESVYDVGRNIENPSYRKNVKDILHANCKRVEEALRVLSEYGQLVETPHWDVSTIEKYRYEIYTIEKLLLKNEKLIKLQNAKLYLVTGGDAPSGCLYNIIEKSIEGGVDIIQLREKNKDEKKILQLGKEIKSLVKSTDVLFIVNDRVDIALALDADGVHLGQDDLPISEARKITPDGFIIGLSTHSKEQAVEAYCNTPVRADYLGVGPVFSTPTKPDYKPVGLEYVRWASDNLKNIPWFTIGGIDETNISKVIESGASKVAVVRAIMDSKDVLQTTRSLKEMLQKDYVPAK